jgi:hypothetical protein
VKRRLWCSVCSLLGVETKGQAAEATKDIWYPYSSSLINGGHEMVRIHLTHICAHPSIHHDDDSSLRLAYLPKCAHPSMASSCTDTQREPEREWQLMRLMVVLQP